MPTATHDALEALAPLSTRDQIALWVAHYPSDLDYYTLEFRAIHEWKTYMDEATGQRWPLIVPFHRTIGSIKENPSEVAAWIEGKNINKDDRWTIYRTRNPAYGAKGKRGSTKAQDIRCQIVYSFDIDNVPPEAVCLLDEVGLGPASIAFDSGRGVHADYFGDEIIAATEGAKLSKHFVAFWGWKIEKAGRDRWPNIKVDAVTGPPSGVLRPPSSVRWKDYDHTRPNPDEVQVTRIIVDNPGLTYALEDLLPETYAGTLRDARRASTPACLASEKARWHRHHEDKLAALQEEAVAARAAYPGLPLPQARMALRASNLAALLKALRAQADGPPGSTKRQSPSSTKRIRHDHEALDGLPVSREHIDEIAKAKKIVEPKTRWLNMRSAIYWLRKAGKPTLEDALALHDQMYREGAGHIKTPHEQSTAEFRDLWENLPHLHDHYDPKGFWVLVEEILKGDERRSGEELIDEKAANPKSRMDWGPFRMIYRAIYAGCLVHPTGEPFMGLRDLETLLPNTYHPPTISCVTGQQEISCVTGQQEQASTRSYRTIGRYLKTLVGMGLIQTVRLGVHRGRDATTYTVKDEYMTEEERSSLCVMTAENREKWLFRLEQRHERRAEEAQGSERREVPPEEWEMDPRWTSAGQGAQGPEGSERDIDQD